MHNITEGTQFPLAAQIVLLVESCLITFFNGIVWLLFLKHPNLRTRSNVFLVSLSSAHFFIGVLGAPFYTWARNAGAFDVVSIIVMYYFLCASILNMYILTYERYLSIIKPLHYNRRMSKRFVAALVCVAWILPVIATLVDGLFRTVMILQRFSLGYLVYRWIQSVSFLSIAALLAVVNTAMFRIAKRQFQAIQAATNINNSNRQVGALRWREKRTTFFFVYIAVTFFVFWLPRIISDVYELVRHEIIEHTVPDIVTLCVALLNPICDPLIYLFFKSDFKKAIRQMLRGRNQINPGVIPLRTFVVENRACST